MASAIQAAPQELQEAELLYETTPLLARMFGFLWPTSERAAYEAEGRLLSLVKAPVSRRLVRAGTNYINTAIVGHQPTEATPATRNIVMCHGYASGLAMWFENFDALAAVPGTRIYAIDWLGKGRSSRPPFRVTNSDPAAVEKSEDFFLDSLEEWRKANNLDRFILVGHSLGGYLSAVYAMRYPQHVERLVLVSPVGVPEKPAGWDDEFLATRKSVVWKLVRYLWDQNWTPQMLLRGAGHLGPRLMRTYTSRRFKSLDADKVDMLREYYYHINARPGSGEYALNTILQVGAYARKPLMSRVSEIVAPTSFIYGTVDWMNPEAGEEAAARMQRCVGFHYIPNAGHHLYMENPVAFNRALVESVMGETQTRR